MTARRIGGASCHPLVVDVPPELESRSSRVERLVASPFDALVVGGGITGAGVALDLACRGLAVALVERGDWGGETSSASSRLLHGGLRYLEQYDFGLVRESCLERSLLMRNAAGLAWPESFTFPLFRGGRVGRLKLAAGLALYSLLSLPHPLGVPRVVGAAAARRAIPGVADGIVGAGRYQDGATIDSRLVWATVRTAMERGAVCASRVEVAKLEHAGATKDDGVEAELTDVLTGTSIGRVRARRVVLCGGPFTEELRARAGLGGKWLSPTRGTHAVLPRHRLPTDGAVVFTSPLDGRVMFLLPWPAHTVIGTTDVDSTLADRGTPTPDEVRYLVDSANALVPAAKLEVADVVSTWSGVRPLLAAPESDPSARSREERVVHEGSVTTIAGGKLTAYRGMAETLGSELCRRAGIGDGRRASPTRSVRLVGALDRAVSEPDWVRRQPDAAGLRRAALVRRHGRFADAVASAEGSDRPIDDETTFADVLEAIRREDALEPADVLLRRTDLGYTRPDLARELEDEIRATIAAERPG
ncbi:MAG: glycerol-3-phosphate dehydrogenase/oxidase [Planctomycetota bacterium]